MVSRNSRTSHPAARSSRAPQSARAVRTAKAAQSGRIASRSEVGSFSGYQSAYTPGSQGRAANGAYASQSAANQYSRNNPTYSAAARKSGRGKKIALGVIAAVLVAVVGGGTAFAFYIDSINKQLNTGTKTEDEISAISDALTTPAVSNFTEPFYMMLIGSDRREGDDSMGARSDTNIVVRVDPVNNQVTLVSIPRDTKIEIEGHGTNKFNAAYSFGGAAGTIEEASKLLDVDIAHYAEVNFEEMVALIDAVGGVDIDVDQRIDDTDADNTTDNPNGKRIIIEPGMQHMDGETALVYSRSRAFPDGDFTRTQHQRTLIMALVDKVLALPVTELPGVIQAAAKCVTTDFSVNDIIGLAQQFKDEGDLIIYSGMVPSTTAMIGEISYVINDAATTKKMMAAVEAGEDPEPFAEMATGSSDYSSSGSGSGYDDGSGYSSGYDSGYSNSGSNSTDNSGYYDPVYGTSDGSYGGTDYSGTSGTDGSYGNGGGYDDGTSGGSVDNSGTTGGYTDGTSGYANTGLANAA